MDYFKRVSRYTPTRLWINNVTRRQARMAIEAGAVCCTQNPAYLSKVIGSDDDGEYLDGVIAQLIKNEPDDNKAASELQRLAIAGICKEFHAIYEKTGGRLGLVSIQADPFHEDTRTILDNARKSRELYDNFIIKIPATQSGLEAIGELIAQRVPVLATEVMSIDQVIEILQLHERVSSSMADPAPFWMAHINGIFDEHLSAYVNDKGVDIAPDILRQGSLLLGRKIRQLIRQKGSNVNYLAGGARNLGHFTDWVGVDGGVTINWKGTADKLIQLDMPVTDVFNGETSFTAIDELTAKVPEFKLAWTPGSIATGDYEHFGPVVRFRNSFEKGWTAAVNAIASARASSIAD